MNRKLIIDGNAVYEIDEECMLKKRLGEKNEEEQKKKGSHESNKQMEA